MANSGRPRPSPEQLLKQVEAGERFERRGKLKVFLGYASGVGKSFRMLDEGRRRKARGEDVVIAATQTDTGPETGEDVAQLVAQLESIPLRTDLGSPSLDMDAIGRRKPSLCLIDGLAYRNPPGSRNAERWQDVEELLAAGISVLTSVNLQYIRERQSQVETIRGRRVEDSVPEGFLKRADEIEIVDAPPEYCITRAQLGNPGEAARLEQQLSQMREIALVLTAEVVDRQLEDYLHRQGIDQTYGAQERVLVCVTPRSNAAVMIHRGKRQADRFHGDLYAAYVEQGVLSPEDRHLLEQNLDMARKVGAQVEVLHGEDPVAAILRHATAHGITQIFVGHSLRTGWLDRIKPDPVERLILEADGMDVRIFPHEEHEP
jgi:two-component system, OmpR family, sensor histidine kinase KdpD